MDRHIIYLLVAYFVDHIVGLHSTDHHNAMSVKEVNIKMQYACCEPL